jgi:hypothetical protein
LGIRRIFAAKPLHTTNQIWGGLAQEMLQAERCDSKLNSPTACWIAEGA